MPSLFQIVYASNAVEDFGRPELLEMLKGSVQRNSRAGITGLLLYRDGCFMQAIEGEETAVKNLFAKISRDQRHDNIITLLQQPVAERTFPNSAMAFRDLEVAGHKNLPGYSEFLNTPLNGDLLAKDIPKCKKLLLYFKQNIR